MSSRWKKIWADFWGNKSRTFLTHFDDYGRAHWQWDSMPILASYMLESMDGDYLSAQPSEATISASPSMMTW